MHPIRAEPGTRSARSPAPAPGGARRGATGAAA